MTAFSSQHGKTREHWVPSEDATKTGVLVSEHLHSNLEPVPVSEQMTHYLWSGVMGKSMGEATLSPMRIIHSSSDTTRLAPGIMEDDTNDLSQSSPSKTDDIPGTVHVRSGLVTDTFLHVSRFFYSIFEDVVEVLTLLFRVFVTDPLVFIESQIETNTRDFTSSFYGTTKQATLLVVLAFFFAFFFLMR